MAVAYWSQALAVETEKVVQRKREEMMQAELEPSKTPDPNGIKYVSPRRIIHYNASASSGLLS